MGPAAAPGPAVDREEAAPGAWEEIVVPGLLAPPSLLLRLRVFSVGRLLESSSNSCGVREPMQAPSAGETSDTLRLVVSPLDAANKRTSPARTSLSNP